MKNSTLKILAVLALVSCSEENVTKDYQTSNPLKSEMDKWVDNTFKNYASKSNTAGFSIAFIENDKVTDYHYGETKIGNQTLPNSNTLYEIGSITKTFSAISMVQLLEETEIDINTSIQEFIPTSLVDKVSKNNKVITFKHLLNHTSGLERIPSNMPVNADPYATYDSVKLYQYLASKSLAYEPGKSPVTESEAYLQYSNLAYGFAGLIVERNTKASLEDNLAVSIFLPLQMSSTTFESIDNETNKAFPFNKNGLTSYWHFSGMAAAGGLKSNLNDMVKYAKAQLNPSSFPSLKNAIELCQQPTVQINSKDYFGLGWEFFYTKTNRRLLVKDGGTGGFTSFIIVDKQNKKALVALFNNNSDNEPYTPLIEVINQFFE
jgi:CubicO group peptidase (beta-lactamase class C family)